MSQSTCIILIFLQHMSKTVIEFYTPWKSLLAKQFDIYKYLHEHSLP